jgi:hypothetical protein
MDNSDSDARFRYTATKLIDLGTGPAELAGLLRNVTRRLKMDPAQAEREIAGFVYRASLDPRFPTPGDAMFYGLPGDLVRTIEPHTEAAPVAILLQFLAAFGIAIGSAPHFMVGEDRHQLKVWPLIVGVTSRGRKGVSASIVKRVLREVDQEFVNSRIQSGLSSGEGLIHAVRDAAEVTKGNGRFKIVDPGVKDKRLLVFESEFASVLRLAKREGSVLSTTMRLAWDADCLRILNKNTPMNATGVQIGIVGHITKEELLRHFDEIEMANGFANRFFWVCAQRTKLLPSPKAIDESLMQPLTRRVRKARTFAATVGEMSRSSSAERLWETFYSKLAMRSGVFLADAILGSAEAQIMRVACRFALLDLSRVVKTTHLRASWELWEFSEASVRYIFGNKLGDPVADKILDALCRADDWFSRTRFMRRLDATFPSLASMRRWIYLDEQDVFQRRRASTLLAVVDRSSIGAQSSKFLRFFRSLVTDCKEVYIFLMLKINEINELKDDCCRSTEIPLRFARRNKRIGRCK